MSLIAKLREKQGDRTQLEFATEIGISQAQLSRLYSGDKGLGIESLKKIVQRYPDLSDAVIAFLATANMPVEQGERLSMSA